jgi:hypothetical protein
MPGMRLSAAGQWWFVHAANGVVIGSGDHGYGGKIYPGSETKNENVRVMVIKKYCTYIKETWSRIDVTELFFSTGLSWKIVKDSGEWFLQIPWVSLRIGRIKFWASMAEVLENQDLLQITLRFE